MENRRFEILLLTNRDSDNVGDQVIEACDIGLITAVMKNLNIRSENYKISSRAASIVSQTYLLTKDPELLKRADRLIKAADLIIFGGAPLFNYLYQMFYERTAVILEIAEKYNKPVIFSAIGVEGYDENNKKCQRLKKTLNFNCVKQITTRDDFVSLRKFKENEQMIVDKVPDPAVFTSKIFEDFVTSDPPETKKKIGIFILRANGFTDNKVNFSRDDAAALWKRLMRELENKNFNYELITSGHFGDEAFLDYLIRKHNVKSNKCVFNINSPEQLIRKIASYDAVVSTRLHPSIIAYSLNVPSVGIVWNSKVTHFYDSIGYGDRVIHVNGIPPGKIVEKVEQAIAQGIEKNKDFSMRVYHSLFHGVRNVLCPEESGITPYSYTELMENMPVYPGTSEKEQEEKIKRKFRRAYGKYNELFDEKNSTKSIKGAIKWHLKKLKNQ